MKKILLLTALLLNFPIEAAQICRTSTRSSPDAAKAIRRDSPTRLQWQHCAVGLNGQNCAQGRLQRLSFMQANDFDFESNRNKLEGHNAWHLPTIKELETLKSPDCVKPAIDLKRFPNTPSVWFWSSSSENLGSAWYLDFESGFSDQDDRNLANAVRLVRNKGLQDSRGKVR